MHHRIVVNWWENSANLAILWRWLEKEGEELPDPADFMEKPWHWDSEWSRMTETVFAPHA